MARISLTLFLHLSLSSIAPGRSSKLLSVSAENGSNKFLQIDQHWYVHVWRSIEERHLALISLAVSFTFCSSYLDGFWDGKKEAVQLLFRGVLLPGFVQYSS